MTARPVLVVDIDGVLNMYGGDCPVGYVEHDLFPEDEEPVRINPESADMLAVLAKHFDLVWGSAWTRAERALLPQVLALPDFVGAAVMPPVPFDPAIKVPIIDQFVGERACAWIDDLHTPEGIAWAEARPWPTLLVHTNPAIGITWQQANSLLAWAKLLARKMH